MTTCSTSGGDSICGVAAMAMTSDSLSRRPTKELKPRPAEFQRRPTLGPNTGSIVVAEEWCTGLHSESQCSSFPIIPVYDHCLAQSFVTLENPDGERTTFDRHNGTEDREHR